MTRLLVPAVLLSAAAVTADAIMRQVETVPPAFQEVPYVAAMMAFAAWMWREHRRDRETDRTSWQEFMAEQREAERRAQAQQREADLAALDRISDRMQEVARALTRLNNSYQRSRGQKRVPARAARGRKKA